MDRIEELQKLVVDGFADWKSLGEVEVKESDGLLLFNYMRDVQEWNFFETISRGLILNKTTGEIVARPFDKFFNWFERGRFSRSPIMQVYEKLDGSLGILYRTEDGELRIATRGSFDSEQAQYATKLLHEMYGLKYSAKLPQDYTFNLFRQMLRKPLNDAGGVLS